MKAAVLNEGKFIITDIRKPTLKENGKGAIVRVIGCGLCGSDIVKVRTKKARNGDVLGHEVVGEIVELDTNTTTFEVGDKIALGHHVPCFNCHYCWNENYSMCLQFKTSNIKPGGFAEYIYVSEEHLKNTVFRINEHLSNEEASFLEPLACCIRAAKKAKLKDDSKSLVIGLGSIGLLMGQAIRARGNKAYGCDLLYERVEFSRNYGFEKSFITLDEFDAKEKVRNIAPLGFDNIFLTAGSHRALDLAINSVRDGGTITVFSSIKNNDGFKNNDIYYRELTIMGSYSPSPMDLEDSMILIESSKVKVSGISEQYPIEGINDAVKDTLSNKIMKAYITL